MVTLLNSRRPRRITLLLRAILGFALIFALSGCSWFQFPGVYRINIQQGNIITQEMVDQLEPGMTKRQVNFVLGTPLIQDSFNLDRWDYYYSLTDAKGNFTDRKFTVYFLDELLIRTEGEYQFNGAPMPDEETQDELEELQNLNDTFSSTRQNNEDTAESSAAL